jgi:hypothetical protein
MHKKLLIALIGFLLSASSSLAEEQKTVPPDTIIALERTMCYGTCPEYKLTIYADGKIEFDGKNYVKAIGHYVKTISLEKVAMILTEVESINFFELNGDYACMGWTDMPTAITTVKKEGATKQIRHYHGCESANKEELTALTELENKIDELAEISDWLKYEISQ